MPPLQQAQPDRLPLRRTLERLRPLSGGIAARLSTLLALFTLLAMLGLPHPRTALAGAVPQSSTRELAWALGADPSTLDPAKVDDAPSELVRYLTGGVLVRTNRHTGAPEPALADRWTLSPDGRTAAFHLRPNLRFSDGSSLTSADAAATLRRVLAPSTEAPVAEEFLDPAHVTVEAPDPSTVVLHLPRRLVELLHILDEIAIESKDHPGSEARITAGPYRLAEYRRGQYLRLESNPYYWRRDPSGVQLPYVASIRLDISPSDEQQQARFSRGQYQFIHGVAPEYFNLLARTQAAAARDLGPSLNTEQLWFNQAPSAPLPAYEKQWFSSTAFRNAVSRAIHRADLARIAYAGHATPAYGFLSPANRTWYDPAGDAPHEDPAAAQALLAKAGFHREAGGHAQLVDPAGHPVRFSILTNAGNPARQRMATLIQQDLAALGMDVQVTTLDFPALIERLLHSQNYEACLLGLANVDPDPNSEMNLWLSSSPNHQWNPGEKTPATPWEASIDAEMKAQASAASMAERLRAIHHVARIVAAEQPFIYLVYPNALYAVSPQLTGLELSALEPGAVWNIDTLRWADGGGSRR